MTTYEQNVHDTAEKFKAIIASNFFNDSDIANLLAIEAVAMKAEGFDEGVFSAKDNYYKTNPDEFGVVDVEFFDKIIEEHKQSLGLTKPTDNEQ